MIKFTNEKYNGGLDTSVFDSVREILNNSIKEMENDKMNDKMIDIFKKAVRQANIIYRNEDQDLYTSNIEINLIEGLENEILLNIDCLRFFSGLNVDEKHTKIYIQNERLVYVDSFNNIMFTFNISRNNTNLFVLNDVFFNYNKYKIHQVNEENFQLRNAEENSWIASFKNLDQCQQYLDFITIKELHFD